MANVIYPFDIEKYISDMREKYLAAYQTQYVGKRLQSKIDKLNNILNEEEKVYVKVLSKLNNTFNAMSKQSDFEFEIKFDAMDDMTRDAIDNFVYMLKIKGWCAHVSYSQHEENVPPIDHYVIYYVNFRISREMFHSKL